MSSAGLIHAFARACSRGHLDRCTCDESTDLQHEETWRWGGCGDNIKFGLKFTRRFLRRAKRGKDVRSKVNQHNSNVGIKVGNPVIITDKGVNPVTIIIPLSNEI